LADTTLLLFETPQTNGYLAHFFHLLEHLVGVWSFYADAHQEEIKRVVLVDGPFVNRPWQGPNQINKHLLNALFPQAEVMAWDNFLNKQRGQTIRFERALTSDRALTFQNLECKKINKMLGAARTSLSSSALDRLAEQVQKYAKCSMVKDPKYLHVTYAKRPPPRRLSPRLEAKMIAALSKIPNVKLRTIDFAEMTFNEQIQTVSTTNVLVSVHGNGLSHLLFLPPNSCVIEIFPPDTLLLDYRLFANARQFEYHGIVANQGSVSDEDAYAGMACNNVNFPVEQLNINALVDIVRKRVIAHRQR